MFYGDLEAFERIGDIRGSLLVDGLLRRQSSRFLDQGIGRIQVMPARCSQTELIGGIRRLLLAVCTYSFQQGFGVGAQHAGLGLAGFRQWLLGTAKALIGREYQEEQRSSQA